MGLRSDSLRFIGGFLFLSLPLLSAVVVSRRNHVAWGAAYIRCLIGYVAGLAMITIGVLFENSLQWLPEVNQYWGGWHIVWEILKFAPSSLYWEEILICASIIQFVVLLKRQPNDFAVAGVRATFLALSVADILIGMVIGFGVQDYVLNVFCNWIGAIAFGVVNTAVIVRLFPGSASPLEAPQQNAQTES